MREEFDKEAAAKEAREAEATVEDDIIEEEREVLEHPLGQVEVDRGAFKEE